MKYLQRGPSFFLGFGDEKGGVGWVFSRHSIVDMEGKGRVVRPVYGAEGDVGAFSSCLIKCSRSAPEPLRPLLPAEPL